MPGTPHARGFTLIELLVVITIIVLLLALIAPALDKAIYRAELVVCGSNLHGIVLGAQQYAISNARSYPHRRLIDEGGTFWQRPDYLQDPTKFIDDRTAMQEYIDLGLMVCPLAGKVDLKNTMDDSNVFSTVALRFGFRWKLPAGGRGMLRLGDKFEWRRNYYGVMVHDWEIVGESSNLVISTHPDRDGVMRQSVVQDSGDADFRYLPGSGDDLVRFTFARWQSSTTWKRGAAEYNFAYDDGSVRFLDNVLVSTADGARAEERMIRVPVSANGEVWTGGAGGWYSHLPK
jgi:prepilin-type N-terminal cleavage/methylation domain-containing protein